MSCSSKSSSRMRSKNCSNQSSACSNNSSQVGAQQSQAISFATPIQSSTSYATGSRDFNSCESSRKQSLTSRRSKLLTSCPEESDDYNSRTSSKKGLGLSQPTSSCVGDSDTSASSKKQSCISKTPQSTSIDRSSSKRQSCTSRKSQPSSSCPGETDDSASCKSSQKQSRTSRNTQFMSSCETETCGQTQSNTSQFASSCPGNTDDFTPSTSQKPSYTNTDDSDECTVLNEPEGITLEGDFTPSGLEPSTTVGALSSCNYKFTKYAPCGHWSTCEKSGCQDEKLYDACAPCDTRTPYGPYGPWTKSGPAQFLSPKRDYIKSIYPTATRRCNGLQETPKRPMGKLAPWPLSGSCRYAGRPHGPCRPFGAYKSRGPFGVWTCKGWPTCIRPITPCQPGWKRTKNGCRPCTPCHRPVFHPCKR